MKHAGGLKWKQYKNKAIILHYKDLLLILLHRFSHNIMIVMWQSPQDDSILPKMSAWFSHHITSHSVYCSCLPKTWCFYATLLQQLEKLVEYKEPLSYASQVWLQLPTIRERSACWSKLRQQHPHMLKTNCTFNTTRRLISRWILSITL